MTPQEASKIALTQIGKHGITARWKREQARRMADMLARNPMANVEAQFFALTSVPLSRTLLYPRSYPVSLSWWKFIQAEAERRRS